MSREKKSSELDGINSLLLWYLSEFYIHLLRETWLLLLSWKSRSSDSSGEEDLDRTALTYHCEKRIFNITADVMTP